MEIDLKDFFLAPLIAVTDQLMACPARFQQQFRKIYQQLRIVDHPLEVKGITRTTDKFYKITIDKSSIGLNQKGQKLFVVCFLYKQFLP